MCTTETVASQNVRLYQPDYEKIKKVADENQISLAEVISQIISNYEKMLQGPQIIHEVKL